MSTLTKYGFDISHLRAERLCEMNGVAIVRVFNRVTGDYVEVQCSRKGRKTHISTGRLKDVEGYLKVMS